MKIGAENELIDYENRLRDITKNSTTTLLASELNNRQMKTEVCVT